MFVLVGVRVGDVGSPSLHGGVQHCSSMEIMEVVGGVAAGVDGGMVVSSGDGSLVGDGQYCSNMEIMELVGAEKNVT